MTSKHVVVAGRASPTLAARLAKDLDAPLAGAELRDFPDGEAYVRILDDVKGKDVVAVQATRTDRDLVELLLVQDAAHEAGAVKVTSVIPYYGYARQDRAFKPGEAVSARAVARALYATANEMVIVDPHKDHILDFFPGVSHGVTAVPQLCEQLRTWGVDAILAPDRGALARAAHAGELLGVPHDHLEKRRTSATEVEVTAKKLDVQDQRVAIVDDLIASGGTMAKAAEQLKRNGAKAVYAACTHGVFTDKAVERLNKAGVDKLLCTDTFEGAPCDVVSAAPAIAKVFTTSMLVQ